MDVIVRRCPFLARVPQAFFQQSKKFMAVYAQKCPIMMELASKPMAPSMARALCSSSSSHQKPEQTMSTTDGKGNFEILKGNINVLLHFKYSS